MNNQLDFIKTVDQFDIVALVFYSLKFPTSDIPFRMRKKELYKVACTRPIL